MKQITKRKVAREIIILFICSVLIGLSWVILWSINEFRISKAEKLEKKTSILSHDIDSIQTRYSKSISFEEMLDRKNVPTEYFDKGRPPIIIPPDFFFDEIMFDEFSVQQTSFFTKRRLFLLLQKLKPPFDIDSINQFAKFDGFKISPFSKLQEPVPFDTLQSISKKFETNFPEKKNLKRYYDFLKTKNCIIVGFKEFCFTMQGLPLPPTTSTSTAYKKYRKEFDEANKDINETKQKINSKDNIIDLIKWIAIIVFTLVYPIRFIYKLLKWSFLTIQTKV
ncbi:hypothetical protein EOD40_08985 [Flavobacterium sufflavum]|uniref:Uncharacterized protein n=1 Tax=Flavobacterium sufflavum TaxID=1921138 RepID=A0A3S2U328_9FLAO|nr:hypothetical protein [Flavobacterium sufflavum]RVT76627.1 hypothetical protein EOD40_08985 [Flavobacterium sufflavum]